MVSLSQTDALAPGLKDSPPGAVVVREEDKDNVIARLSPIPVA